MFMRDLRQMHSRRLSRTVEEQRHVEAWIPGPFSDPHAYRTAPPKLERVRVAIKHHVQRRVHGFSYTRNLKPALVSHHEVVAGAVLYRHESEGL